MNGEERRGSPETREGFRCFLQSRLNLNHFLHHNTSSPRGAEEIVRDLKAKGSDLETPPRQQRSKSGKVFGIQTDVLLQQKSVIRKC